MREAAGCALGMIEQLLRYVYWKSGGRGFVVGVSGGIDSAVAATMCCRAVGPERVLGLTLPTRVTDPSDIADAEEVCRRLSMECRTICIEPVLSAYRAMPGFQDDQVLVGTWSPGPGWPSCTTMPTGRGGSSAGPPTGPST